ncbi:uncharacterized protein LOC144876016 [Branchiostoma floridae x Branchiostoma japonicum]
MFKLIRIARGEVVDNIGHSEMASVCVPAENYHCASAGPILLAGADSGKLRTVEMALEAGADIDFEGRGCGFARSGTALAIAIARGHVDVVRLLLREGASVAKKVMGEFSLLHVAASEGKTEVVDLLVQHGATLDTRDGSKNTPLMAAAGNNHVDTVRRLIELGANPDLTDGYIAVVSSLNGPHGSSRLGLDGRVKRPDYRCRESIRLIQEARKSKLLRCCNPKCGKPGYRKTGTLKLCGRCKLTRYCSRDCQIQHWSVGHKKCCGHDVYS